MKKLLKAAFLMLMVCLMLAAQCAGALADLAVDTREADPSTIEHWKNHFSQTPQSPNTLNTLFAGGVWTDKSVYTNIGSGEDFSVPISPIEGNDKFLVVLSAIASTESISGYSKVPTDTMFILDISSSMYSGESKDPDVVNAMLDALNETIDKLMDTTKMHPENRVGITLYWGGNYIIPQSTSSSSSVLLPLDRYTRTGSTYVNAVVSSGDLRYIRVSEGVTGKMGGNVSSRRYPASGNVPSTAGTYAQQGILQAMNEFLKDSISPKASDGTDYLPVFVFMSDGKPTAATEAFADALSNNATMGNNQELNRQPNQTDFVTQLTAAYAKERVDIKYTKHTPLFYTLADGTSVSYEVMDPANHTNATINGYWSDLVNNGTVSFTTKAFKSSDSTTVPTQTNSHTVRRVSLQSGSFPAFPSSTDQRLYVDKSFIALYHNFADAFSALFDEITLESRYIPTLIVDGEDANLSGSISFVDTIGEYMTVTDVRGVGVGGVSYTGDTFAKAACVDYAFGSTTGTYVAPTDAGVKLLDSLMRQTGITDRLTGAQLFQQARIAGQIAYNSASDYSNYVGWYADANNNYLGFWNEGVTTQPAGAAYTIKSYLFYGETDESDTALESDMLFLALWVRTDLKTQQESVVLSVPASLVPLVSYDVKLDANGNATALTASGATRPLKALYEVGLKPGINEITLLGEVDSAYLAANKAPDSEGGGYYFYTNEWDRQQNTGYEAINTYSYFRPSKENPRYYYTEPAVVYSDENGTVCKDASLDPNGTYFRKIEYYEKVGSAVEKRVYYRQLSPRAIGKAARQSDGSYLIAAGTVHVNTDGYLVDKASNLTDTFAHANVPYVDTHNTSDGGDGGMSFIVGATLGNNGRLRIVPTTALSVTKRVTQVNPNDTDGEFTFALKKSADDTVASVSVSILSADGTLGAPKTLTFDEKDMVVFSLKKDETAYFTGVTVGKLYQVFEQGKDGYVLKTIVTTQAGKTETIDVDPDASTEAGAFLTPVSGETVSAEFTNTSATETLPYSIPGSKTLNGMTLNANMFQFVLVPAESDGTATQNAHKFIAYNAADGSFSFDNLLYAGTGEQYYLLYEEPTEGTQDHSIEFDSTQYLIQVSVTRDAEGKLTASHKIIKKRASSTSAWSAAAADEAVQFVNTRVYAPNSKVQISAIKHLWGRDLAAGEFTFRLYASDADWTRGTLLQTQTNGADGVVLFDPFTYVYNEDQKDVGYHYYLLEEDSSATDNILYDPVQYLIRVQVYIYQESVLETSVTIWDQEGSEAPSLVYGVPQFSNTVVDPVNVSLEGVKQLIGRKLAANDFSFLLFETGSDFVVPEGAVPMQTVLNNADGTFQFAEWQLTSPGTYYYVVREDKTNPLPGIVYDNAEYHVTFTVTKNMDTGELVVDGPQIVAVDSKTAEEGIIFINRNFPSGDLPLTGDSSKLALWLSAALASLAGMVFVLRRRAVR